MFGQVQSMSHMPCINMYYIVLCIAYPKFIWLQRFLWAGSNMDDRLRALMWNSVSYANSTKSVSQHVFFVCVYASCTVISGYKSLWIIWWSKNNAQETGDYFIACSLGASIMRHKHQAYIKAIALAHMQEASGQKCAVISDYRSETLQWRWPDLSF